MHYPISNILPNSSLQGLICMIFSKTVWMCGRNNKNAFAFNAAQYICANSLQIKHL